MDDQNRNLILATALSFLVILVWFFLFPPPEQTAPPAVTEQTLLPPVSEGAPATGAEGVFHRRKGWCRIWRNAIGN